MLAIHDARAKKHPEPPLLSPLLNLRVTPEQAGLESHFAPLLTLLAGWNNPDASSRG